jgi:hypothetical protein
MNNQTCSLSQCSWGNAPEETTGVLQNFEGIAKTPMIPATISTIRKKKARPFLIGSDFSHGCREEKSER